MQSQQNPPTSNDSQTKWIKPKFDANSAINSTILQLSTLAPNSSPILLKHVSDDLAPRSKLNMESPDLICYNEWYFNSII